MHKRFATTKYFAVITLFSLYTLTIANTSFAAAPFIAPPPVRVPLVPPTASPSRHRHHQTAPAKKQVNTISNSSVKPLAKPAIFRTGQEEFRLQVIAVSIFSLLTISALSVPAYLFFESFRKQQNNNLSTKESKMRKNFTLAISVFASLIAMIFIVDHIYYKSGKEVSVLNQSENPFLPSLGPIDGEIVLSGKGLVKFSTTSQGTIIVDDQDQQTVDPSIYKVSYANGGYMYTDQPKYNIEGSARIRLTQGFLTFEVVGNGTVRISSTGTVKVTGNGQSRITVDEDMAVFFAGDSLFEVDNLPLVCLQEMAHSSDKVITGKLLSHNCPSVLVRGNTMNVENTRAYFFYFDEEAWQIIQCKQQI